MTTPEVDISPYVSSTTDDVFALRNLPEEVIAVLFAYYSRSPHDLRTNLRKLLADDELAVGQGAANTFALASEKARKFHEKWVVGYGHSSVAEGAIVHLALENVSIIASKIVEDARLASFTEKSTRYVVFDRNAFVVPYGLSSAARDEHVATCEHLFDTYLSMVPQVIELLRAAWNRLPNQSAVVYENVLRANALDICRGLLPAATKTNIGLTANARTLAHLIQKMGAHPLTEAQRLADELTIAGRTVVPTLLKYVEPSQMHGAMRNRSHATCQSILSDTRAKALSFDERGNTATIIDSDQNVPWKIARALSYQFANTDVQHMDVSASVGFVDRKQVQSMCQQALIDRGPHEGAPRAFEAAHYTIELVLDYGAYRDLQRHRMLSPYAGTLTPLLGATVPPELRELSSRLASTYDQAVTNAWGIWERIVADLCIKHDEYEARMIAQYVVPLAYRIRVLWQLNLRELIHIIELRSGGGGHASYRLLAQSLYSQLIQRESWLGRQLRVDMSTPTMSRM